MDVPQTWKDLVILDQVLDLRIVYHNKCSQHKFFFLSFKVSMVSVYLFNSIAKERERESSCLCAYSKYKLYQSIVFYSPKN